jgi:pimeloyl-ACP methyl ester carboxylesterase
MPMSLQPKASQRMTWCLRIPAAILLATLVLFSHASARQSPPAQSERIVLITADSLRLMGSIFIPTVLPKAKPGLVVLLQSETGATSDWKPIVEVLYQYGFAVLTMEMRGCGQPIFDMRVHQNRPPNTTMLGDRERYPIDVAQMVSKALQDYAQAIDTTKLALIGSSFGGNVGLVYASTEPRVLFTALISPGLEIRGVQVTPFVMKFGNRPLLLAAGSKDSYSVESCYLLADVVPRPLDIRVYDSFFSGNQLLKDKPDLVKAILDGLNKYLK